MNKGQQFTFIGIVIAILGLLGLELYTLVNDQENDTISEVVQSVSHRWIFIPFLTGFLMGHWFWPLDVRKRRKT